MIMLQSLRTKEEYPVKLLSSKYQELDPKDSSDKILFNAKENSIGPPGFFLQMKLYYHQQKDKECLHTIKNRRHFSFGKDLQS